MATAGRPMLYGTTDEFLRQFGLTSVADLPPQEFPSVGDGADEEAQER
jgi:segregation and condensation protein B